MIDRKIFFSRIRKSLFNGRIGFRHIEGINVIVNLWEQSGSKDLRSLAYILATAYHETAYTFQPIKERGGAAYLTANYDITGNRPRLAHKNGNIHPGDGARYAGRGFVQLTWRNNYRAVGKKLGLDLEGNPSRAMQIDTAAIILIRGMQEGWFTGRKLTQYFNSKTEDWINARRTVNGLDKAASIAAKGKLFLAAMMRIDAELIGLADVPPLIKPVEPKVKPAPIATLKKPAPRPKQQPKVMPESFQMPPLEGR